MKKSFLLTVVMILMFSIQSYGIIDTVVVFDVSSASAPLAGITIKAYNDGVFIKQNITTTQGCLLNITTKIGDTIKIVPQNIYGKDSVPKYTFSPLQVTIIIRSVANKTYLVFDAYCCVPRLIRT